MFSSVNRPVGRPVKRHGQHDHGELADALEGVGQQADDVDQGEEHHAQVGEVRAGVAAEARLDPLRAGEHVRAAQPRRS